MGIHTQYLQDIEEDILKNILKDNYSIQANNFTPIPSGEMGECYKVSVENDNYFLKILHKNKIDSVKNLDATLILTDILKKSGIKEIAYPIQTLAGNLRVQFKDYYLILQNFIAAKSANVLLPEDVAKIAVIVARIHNSLTRDTTIEKESYTTEYADKLIIQLESIEREKDVWSQAARDLLSPYKTRLQADLERLHYFSNRVNMVDRTMVITHGDLINNNILKDEEGNIFIVDWDMAKLATPERDLWFFAKDYPLEFLNAYQKQRKCNVDINVIGFFLYKRYLEDIVYWLEEVLTKDVSDEQKHDDLKGIKVSCLEAFEDIEGILKKFKIG